MELIDQSAIFAPFFILLLLTFCVWIYMYAKRLPFIRSNHLTAEQFVPLEFARLQPPAVSNPSDNLKNLFELPTLFYAICFYLYLTAQVDQTTLVAAWIFVLFRIMHSLVHCSVNIVMLRFALYCVSAFALWFLIFRAALSSMT